MFPDPLPPRIRDDRSRRAEVRVYDSLVNALPNNVRAIHSVAWLNRSSANDTPQSGEADFVIVDPQFGLLILEVKGGGIDYDSHSGDWWSTDTSGQAHPIKNPFEQTQRSKSALLAKIRELPRFRDGRWINISQAVVFPDLGRIERSFGPQAPREILISGDDLPRLGARIHEIYNWSVRSDSEPLSGADCDELERLLAPRTQIRASVAVAARSADAEIVSLTEDQFDVLAYLSRTRRVAVSGAAGSGKSLLAAEEAKRLAAQGFRTLFVCFNAPLAKHLAAQLKNQPGLEVRTFHDFCRAMAIQAGLLPADYVDDAPTTFFARLPDLLLEALQLRADLRYDALVVDEGQDFEQEWWALLELTLANPEDGVVFVFHDDSQGARDRAHTLPSNLSPISLTRNLRNTRAIHELARRFSLHSEVQSAGPEGQPITLVEIAEGEPLLRTLSREIERLMREEQFRAEEITILSGHGRATTALAGLERIGPVRCGTPPTIIGVVGVDTIRRFKGLDSRIVVLVELDDLLDSPEWLYVGITRARTRLVVIGTAGTLARFRN